MFRRTRPETEIHTYVEARLSDYIDGQLSADESARVRTHLASCDSCRASYETLRWTVSLLKQTPAPALPRQFTLPVTHGAVKQGMAPWLVWGLRGVAVAATAAFVILLTVNLVRAPQTTNQAALAPAAAQPSVVVAMQQSSPAARSAAAGAVNAITATSTPIMITVEPPPDTPEPTQEMMSLDVATVVPAPAQNNNPPPPAEPTKPPPVQKAQAPTRVPPAAASGASAPNNGAPLENSTLASPTASGLSATAAEESLPTAQVNTEGLMVRAGPGTQYRQLGTFKRGQLVKLTGRDQSGRWLEIEYTRNRKTGHGWIGASFVATNAVIANLPIVSAPADETPNAQPTAIPKANTTQDPFETPNADAVDSTPTTTPNVDSINPPDGDFGTATPIISEQGSPTPNAPDNPTATPTKKPRRPAVAPANGF